jgi:hypothetical protein
VKGEEASFVCTEGCFETTVCVDNTVGRTVAATARVERLLHVMVTRFQEAIDSMGLSEIKGGDKKLLLTPPT